MGDVALEAALDSPALDDFESRGERARAAVSDAVDRLPVDSALPELIRAAKRRIGTRAQPKTVPRQAI